MVKRYLMNREKVLTMKKIAIFPNQSRDPEFDVTRKLVEEIVRQGGQAIVEPELAGSFKSDLVEYGSYKDCDLLICLGGDGTFLSAVHHASSMHLPKIGINLGSVGFLMEIEADQIEPSVRQLLAGDFTIENRRLLNITCFNHLNQAYDRGMALNDIVLTRGWGNTGIVTVDLTIDDNFVEQIPGDGVIVSTSTGSTAYNLAAGGPIVHPLVNVLLITPLAPHTLHNRTYIADSGAVVKLQLKGNRQVPALLSIDGRQIVNIESQGYALISLSDQTLKKINLSGDKFYQTLPNKIRLRGMTK